MSKQFCGALAVLLARDGVLDLDAPVAGYLPELRVDLNGATFRSLLCMTTGLHEELDLVSFGSGADPLTCLHTVEKRAALICRHRGANFPPGDRYCYSNSSYTLAQRIIERAADAPYADLLRERIFSPLGMVRTSFEADPRAACAGLATGYEPAPRGFSSSNMAPEISAAGGIVSTVPDLTLWHRNLRTNALYDGDLCRDLLQRPLLNSGSRTDYGLGLFEREFCQRRTLYHGGNLPGWACESVWFPDDDLAVVVLANRSDVSMVRRAREIAMLALSGRSDVGLAGEGVIATAQCGVYVNEDKNLITRIGVRERRVAFNNQFAHLRDASTFDLPFAEASIDYRIEGSADRGVLIRRERGCQPVRLTKACMGDIVIDQSWAGFYRDDQHHWAVELRSDGSGFAMTFAPRWSGALTMLLRPVSSVQFEVTDRGGTPHWGASVLLSERSGVRELSLSTPRTFDFRFMNREGASC